jgi:thiamine-phosphate diphosphorylase
VGVDAVYTPPVAFLEQQLQTLMGDLPPSAIKIGMLGTEEHVRAVGSFLDNVRKQQQEQQPSDPGSSPASPAVRVVLDPVMVSTSGHRLIPEQAQRAMISHLLDRVDIITPNRYEAEALLGGRKLRTVADVEQAARDLIELGARAVLIKGGHTFTEEADEQDADTDNEGVGGGGGVAVGCSYAQDYFLSSSSTSTNDDNKNEPRLCDGSRGVWFRSVRYVTPHTHGTGCTLSSAMTSAVALLLRGSSQAEDCCWTDAVCLAKAYVTRGIDLAVELGKGPGPVVHTEFPSSHRHFPRIVADPCCPDLLPFRRMRTPTTSVQKQPQQQSSDEGGMVDSHDGAVPALGRILPIVDTTEWVERLCATGGVTDVQLRIKGEHSNEQILHLIRKCQDACSKAGVRLWINDYWEAAIEAGCFGVHVGQEDLVKCLEAGGLEMLRQRNVALGVSTHSYGELAVALGVQPTYVSLGPVFATDSKAVSFGPQGLDTVSKWRQLVPPDVPLVAIGGIGDPETAHQVREAGADCVAVIGAVTRAADPAVAVKHLNDAMSLDR